MIVDVTKKEQIIPLLAFMNDTSIAKSVGVSREYVRQVRNKYGIPNNDQYHQRCSVITEEQLGKILEIIEKTNNLSEAARVVGHCPCTITHLLNKYGIKKDKVKITHPTVANKTKNAVKEMTEKGFSAQEIANILGVTRVCVYHHKRKLYNTGKCSYEGCDGNVWTRGICRAHYSRELHKQKRDRQNAKV
jgi:hypothetical protein